MKISKELYDELSKLTEARLSPRGREVCNPMPVEMPVKMRKPEGLHEQIKRILRIELSRQVSDQGAESFEEANDFNVDDGFETEPYSPYVALEEEYLGEGSADNALIKNEGKLTVSTNEDGPLAEGSPDPQGLSGEPQ